MSKGNRFSSWASVVLFAASMACAGSAQAQKCEQLETYGAYARCRVSAGKKPVSAAAWIRTHSGKHGSSGAGSKASAAHAGKAPAHKSYQQERARHDVLRARANVLAEHPKMARYQSRANDLKADDDRNVKAFDAQATTASGAEAALPGLKRHDDKLDKMLAQVESVVKS